MEDQTRLQEKLQKSSTTNIRRIIKFFGRFLPQRDRNFLERINKELVGDLKSSNDGIINQKIVIYKISTYDTSTNMYGEPVGGKNFKKGVQIFVLLTQRF